MSDRERFYRSLSGTGKKRIGLAYATPFARHRIVARGRLGGVSQPQFIALAATIFARRKAHYDALEAANKDNEISAWLRWFAETALDARRLRGQLNHRRQKALLLMLREEPLGFEDGLSPKFLA